MGRLQSPPLPFNLFFREQSPAPGLVPYLHVFFPHIDHPHSSHFANLPPFVTLERAWNALGTAAMHFAVLS